MFHHSQNLAGTAINHAARSAAGIDCGSLGWKNHTHSGDFSELQQPFKPLSFCSWVVLFHLSADWARLHLLFQPRWSDWVCWKPETACWFCQLTKPVCPGLALSVLAVQRQHSQVIFSWQQSQVTIFLWQLLWGMAGCGSRTWEPCELGTCWGAKGCCWCRQGRQIGLHSWEWAQEHKGHTAVQQQSCISSPKGSQRTLDPALIPWLQRTEWKCPSSSFRD